MNGMRYIVLVVTGLGCLLVGCGKKSANDKGMQTDIQGKLSGDPMTKPANLTVKVANGIVTLSGDVPSSDAELEAMKIANSTPGVASVSDQMKVNPNMALNQASDAGTPPPSSNPTSYPPVSQPASAQPAPPPPEPSPAAVPASVTIPAGERVTVRTIDRINSATNTTGQIFRATLYAPLVSHGRVIVPAGARVSLLLAEARDAGRVKGRAELEVRLSRIDYRGRWYPVDSSIYEEEGKARGKQTAVRTGVGAAAGAVIGAIAGGGKGAAIGSAAGGGAGFGSALFTHGQQVKIPSESILTFRLRAPLTVQQ